MGLLIYLEVLKLEPGAEVADREALDIVLGGISGGQAVEGDDAGPVDEDLLRLLGQLILLRLVGGSFDLLDEGVVLVIRPDAVVVVAAVYKVLQRVVGVSEEEMLMAKMSNWLLE